MRRSNITAWTVASAIALWAVAPRVTFAQGKPQGKQASSQAKAPAAAPAGFYVVLLVGDERQAPKAGDVTPPWAEQLTPAVVKALRDVQQFLPFKSYQVFDSTFIRGERGSTSMKSPGNLIYLVNINSWAMLNDTARFYVNLTVKPSDPAFLTKDGAKPDAAVLTTTLEMSPGETIVAGTSRQPGSGTALVMVVTALTPSALRQ